MEKSTEKLSTKELAARHGVKPSTVWSAKCRFGEYFGWRPEKLPNRFLVWSKMEGANE